MNEQSYCIMCQQVSCSTGPNCGETSAARRSAPQWSSCLRSYLQHLSMSRSLHHIPQTAHYRLVFCERIEEFKEKCRDSRTPISDFYLNEIQQEQKEDTGIFSADEVSHSREELLKETIPYPLGPLVAHILGHQTSRKQHPMIHNRQ